MSRSPRLLWARFGGELALAGCLLALVDVPALAPRLALAPSLALGAAVGVALVPLLAGRLPPPPRIERGRVRLVLLKGALLALGSTAEEVLWRWLAIGSLTGAVGLPGAYAVTTLGFALAHRSPRGPLVHLVTGACFGGVYLATGRLAAAACAHVAYNLCVLLAAEAAGARLSTSSASGP